MNDRAPGRWRHLHSCHPSSAGVVPGPSSLTRWRSWRSWVLRT